MDISKNVIARELLPKTADLKLLGLEISKQGWAVEAEGNSDAVCPTCATRSRSRHSRYRRKLQDLPVQGSPVMVELQVGRWRCGNGQCARKIFTERVAELGVPWARRTTRLQEVVRLIGHENGLQPNRIVSYDTNTTTRAIR
jgi:transposase